MSKKPIFQQITQVAMVVKSVEVSAKRYWDDLGIGPWQFYTLNPTNTGDMRLRGEPVKHAFRAALTRIGDVSMELIEPLDSGSIYAKHLAEHGEGLHHVAFKVEDFKKTKEHLKKKNYSEIQSGRPFNIAQYTYFDLDKGLACIAEVGSTIDEGRAFPDPDFTYP